MKKNVKLSLVFLIALSTFFSINAQTIEIEINSDFKLISTNDTSDIYSTKSDSVILAVVINNINVSQDLFLKRFNTTYKENYNVISCIKSINSRGLQYYLYFSSPKKSNDIFQYCALFQINDVGVLLSLTFSSIHREFCNQEIKDMVNTFYMSIK